MSATIDVPIRAEVWERHAHSKNGAPFDKPLPRSPDSSESEQWALIIGQLEKMRGLEDDWDGLGAKAPPEELLASAIGLAYCWIDVDLVPPTRVVPTTAGTILFEWHGGEKTYAEVEVDRPFHADVMLKRSDRPPEHWELPTH